MGSKATYLPQIRVLSYTIMNNQLTKAACASFWNNLAFGAPLEKQRLSPWPGGEGECAHGCSCFVVVSREKIIQAIISYGGVKPFSGVY
jgi:hypothetical protein